MIIEGCLELRVSDEVRSKAAHLSFGVYEIRYEIGTVDPELRFQWRERSGLDLRG
jgi:hypothetical protein